MTQARKELDQNIPAVAKRHGRNWDIFKIREETPEQAQAAIHAYYACASFIDDQIGLMLDALEESGLADNTIVIFTSDHGFHLGEHGMWSKISLFEQATMPCRIRASPMAYSRNRELVDLYPLVTCWVSYRMISWRVFFFLAKPRLLEKGHSICRRASTLRSIRTKSHRYTEWIDTQIVMMTMQLFDSLNCITRC